MTPHYEAWVYDEIDHCVRGMLDVGMKRQLATTAEDLGGVDFHYVLNGHARMQCRVRFDRPAWAADSDVTFRTTEPRMIAVGTYAELALFAWFIKRRIVAAKVIDVYHMAAKLVPALADRPVTKNRDGTGFHTVRIGELHDAGALVRLFDGKNWTTQCLQGEIRLRRILRLPVIAQGSGISSGT